MKKTLLAVLLLQGCNFYIPGEITIRPETPGENPPPVEGSLSFEKDVQPILAASCTRCHGASGGVNLETYEETLKSVKVGDPDESVLCYVLEHQLMPPRGPFLSNDKVELVCGWIADGAKK